MSLVEDAEQRDRCRPFIKRGSSAKARLWYIGAIDAPCCAQKMEPPFYVFRSSFEESRALRSPLALASTVHNSICSTCTDLKLCWWCLLRTINKAIQRCLEARATSPLHGIWTLTICCSKRNLSISFDSTSSQSCRAAAAVPSPPLTTHPDRHSGSRSSWGRSSVDRHTRGEGKPPLMKGCQQQIH